MPHVVLVTGATGFLGSRLVSRLLKTGQSVRVLVRDASRLATCGLDPDDLEMIVGDITDPDAVARAISGVATVYHCAAFVGLGGLSDRPRLRRVNVGGTATIVNAAIESGVRRMVFTSSIAALGRSDEHTECLDENTEWTESPLNSAYAISKYHSELEVYRGIAEGLDAVVVNPSVIMGPGRRGENTMQIAESIYRRKLPALPSGATNVVDVEDVVSGHMAAMENGKCGERYLLAGENLSWTAIIETLARSLNVPPPTRTMSLRAALFLGGISELLSVVTKKPPLISRETARLTGHRVCYENRKARTELGLEFRPFSETASRIAAMFDA